ncbi:tRNA lysidine(34) synthetase TilS [Neptunomonas japonica]|uniref:tRNA(Ile)-lysidine synthase n=1 Tax=Neptunomonas japonica JAMM 1380 TaxID=1441457 RepID=A0A7R6SUP1_9GAMM|nr:tRNA lysidine(34) synthetase TilS [Neptunomonas japonica]BBB28546.1 tRNA(Ile)-lysidine synthase [Neptunomonas japonica JAMM 1380]
MSRLPLIADFLESINQYPAKRWVIALSGGLDSIVMLHLAASNLPSSMLHVLHINHHLQSSADEWSTFCKSQSEDLSLPFSQIDVFPENNGEAAARDARYLAFKDFLQDGDGLLLAHHADDQAETILFRLLRGSGLRGLAGIPTSRKLGANDIVRPLLSVSRADIESYAHMHQLDWVEDPTNQQDTYDRNFLRLNVLPVLKQRWPNVVERFSSTSRLLYQDRELLDKYLDEEIAGLMLSERVLNGLMLASLTVGKRKALIRRWIYTQQGEPLNEVQLLQLEQNFFQSGLDKNPELILKTGVLRRYRKDLYLCANLVSEKEPNVQSLSEGQHKRKAGILTVESEISGSSCLKTLDKLICVQRKDGMHCKPVGRGTKSLKKLFQEASIPPWQRENWPVCMIENEIVAIPGICVCEGWSVSPSELPGFSLRWEPF